MVSYPTFAENSMAGIALNRAVRFKDKKVLTSHWRDGVHYDTWQSWTFSAMVGEGFKLYEAWTRLGVNPQDRVAIIGKNRPRWVFTCASLLTSNITMVPVYPTLTAREAAFILKDSGAKYAVADTLEQAKKIVSEADQCPGLKKIYVMDRISGGDGMIAPYDELVSMSGGTTDMESIFRRVRDIKPDDLAALIYTSGTTGLPKGVMLTNANFLSQQVVVNTFGFNHNDVFLNHLPFCHSFGFTGDLAASIDLGAEMVISDGIQTEQIRHALTTIRPTVLMSVPRLYEKLFVEVKRVVSGRPAPVQALFKEALAIGKEVFDLKNEGRKIPLAISLKYMAAKQLLSAVRHKAGLDRVRVAFAGGGPTSRELCYFFQSLGIDIFQGYGLTETSPICNVNVPGRNKMGTVGPVISGVEERLAEDGEILVRGPNLMKGYFNDPGATAEAIDADGWFHTGDIGTFDPDGYLTITDRKKELIVTAGGKNIAPLKLETAFNTEQYIERAVVIGDRRKYLVALVCPNFELLSRWAKRHGIKAETNAALAAHPEVVRLLEARVEQANRQFAKFEQIKKIAVMDHEFSDVTGELTPTQKVKRRVVEEKYKTVLDGLYPKDEEF
jgi:long-chain acyl-CoA synthetase